MSSRIELTHAQRIRLSELASTVNEARRQLLSDIAKGVIDRPSPAEKAFLREIAACANEDYRQMIIDIIDG